jgi:hypothetical protein
MSTLDNSLATINVPLPPKFAGNNNDYNFKTLREKKYSTNMQRKISEFKPSNGRGQQAINNT